MMVVEVPKGSMLTLKEAAELLGLHPDTLRQQANAGVFKARKLGRDWIASPLEVERYAREHRRV